MEGPSLAGAPCCWPSPEPPAGPGRRHRAGRSWKTRCEEAAVASRTSRERRRSAPVPPRSAPRTPRARRDPARRIIAAASWCEVRPRVPVPPPRTLPAPLPVLPVLPVRPRRRPPPVPGLPAPPPLPPARFRAVGTGPLSPLPPGAGPGGAARLCPAGPGVQRGSTTPARPCRARGTRTQREKGERSSFAFKPVAQEKSVTERRRVRGYLFLFFLFIYFPFL